eukprot:m.139561 g.139561  ORF g.139561 m.139561 type:complete len:197 (+) comp13170_c0_seq6:77-667(+)
MTVMRFGQWIGVVSLLVVAVVLAVGTQQTRAIEWKAKQPAVIFFAPHKSGSSFIEKIMKVLTKNLKLCHFGTFLRTSECSKATRCTGKLPPIRPNELEDKCDAWTVETLKNLRTRAKYEIDGGSRIVLRSNGFVWGPIRTSLHHTVDETALDAAIDHVRSHYFLDGMNSRIFVLVVCKTRSSYFYPLFSLCNKYSW